MGGVFSSGDEASAFSDKDVEKKIKEVCSSKRAVPKKYETGVLKYLDAQGLSPLAIGSLLSFLSNDNLSLEAAKDVFTRRFEFRKKEEYPNYSSASAALLTLWLGKKGFFDSTRSKSLNDLLSIDIDSGSPDTDAFWCRANIAGFLKEHEQSSLELGSVPRLLHFLSTCSFTEDDNDLLSAVEVMSHLNKHYSVIVSKFLKYKADNSQRLRLYVLSVLSKRNQAILDKVTVAYLPCGIYGGCYYVTRSNGEKPEPKEMGRALALTAFEMTGSYALKKLARYQSLCILRNEMELDPETALFGEVSKKFLEIF